ncbi:MAG TPA: alpha-E domain-containing protein [Dissulfurispiraceae bacterium]|nr:alpha-E domain-containing protein [Dissulfurispiraceae bacterium]
MLSRIADSIYWMSRYLQRAGDTARLMEINLLYLIEAQDDLTKDDKWRSLLSITSAEDAFAELYGGEITQSRVLHFMTAEKSNGNSIRSCIRLARENARIVRDRISKEMWEAINGLWLAIDQRLKKPLQPLKATQFFSFVRSEAARFSGLTSSTMMRGEGYVFYSLGAYTEQADMTARILDVKYHLMLPDISMVGSALDYYQWAALLKSLSGYEAFRRKYHSGFRPIDVVEFVIFDPDFPRSLVFAVKQLRDAIESAGTGNRKNSCRAIDKVSAMLNGNSADKVFASGLHEFLDEFLTAIAALNRATEMDFLDLYAEDLNAIPDRA